jgi:hypothetical protein
VGGAPGVAGAVETEPLCGSLRHATAAPITPSGAVIRNCLRVFIGIPIRVYTRPETRP